MSDPTTDDLRAALMDYELTIKAGESLSINTTEGTVTGVKTLRIMNGRRKIVTLVCEPTAAALAETFRALADLLDEGEAKP